MSSTTASASFSRPRFGRGAFVSGIGAVTGYGWSRKYLWDGLLSGEPSARLVPGYGEFLPEDEAWMSLVEDDGDPADGPSRFSRAVAASTREAIEDALDRGWEPGMNVGLIHGVVLGEVDLWKDFYRKNDGRVTRKQYVNLMPSTPLSMLMQQYDFHGPTMLVSAMCASGNASMLTAKAWLDAGIVSDVIVVVTDLSGTAENVKHFKDLGVLVADAPPLDACRPFQEGSRGYSMGEASVAFVVGKEPLGAYASLLGGAMTHDGHHAISLAPDHVELERCFREAMANAKITPSEVRYLNAHGPGTAQCDTAEAHVFDKMLTSAEGLFSFKPLVGHCQGAAAAVELAASCMSFEYGCIPAPPQVAPGHARLLNGRTPLDSGVVLKSSIGMGGHNTVVALASPYDL